MDIRQPANPRDFGSYSTDRIREEFLVQDLFKPDSLNLTYSYIDRMVIGGACPVKPIVLEGIEELGTEYFLERRELGVINIGPPGSVEVDGKAYKLGRNEGLFVGQGARDVLFSSRSAEEPARFYMLSGPAHQHFPSQKIALDDVESVRLGTPEQCNVRVLNKYIHPDGVKSANLVMGLTVVEPGSVWNSIPPCHTHARRMEVYLYYDLKPGAVLFHLMGQPQNTRHIVVGNEEAVISPSWSIHAGCGLSDYTFIWGMVGDNQKFADMDTFDPDQLK
jgi:4-deoxy-L-threo-5-hexosulose-uronate ketol-isomerase